MYSGVEIRKAIQHPTDAHANQRINPVSSDHVASRRKSARAIPGVPQPMRYLYDAQIMCRASRTIDILPAG